ncbi:N-acetylglucosamine kinase [Wenjunlia tyrosinilytica]|uniref:N-acetylglucosamine kinase n=2 Tax=Wenjunlia tyrosinilytica TaxID=1544741 RepID=A0A917ZU26_9ACTN|nr:N-acetylglucosamine kinase [Wenjunlia tyrosinilytica]
MHGPGPLVLGVDAGGTSTRALIADLDGRVLARARGAGANPLAHGMEEALAALQDTVRRVLHNLDPQAVGFAVLGLAGDELTREGGPAEKLDAALRDAGLGCPYTVVGDALVAFAAGTPEPEGTVLIAGTGAVAVRVVKRSIAETAGGYGWLLGDEGSGFWLGREAVRLAADTLRGRGHALRLTELVAGDLLGGPSPAADRLVAERLIAAAYAGSPMRLSTLAPHVSAAALAGDRAAQAVLDRAAAHLTALLADVRAAEGPTRPVVLAGSCLTPGVLGDRTARAIAASGEAQVLFAREGSAGAAWLAALPLLEDSPSRLAALHSQLVTAGRPR